MENVKMEVLTQLRKKENERKRERGGVCVIALKKRFHGNSQNIQKGQHLKSKKCLVGIIFARHRYEELTLKPDHVFLLRF